MLLAIRWVAEAWDLVKEETIKKCFTKSGITVTGSSSSVVSRLYEDEDPFDDIEAEEELHELCDLISPSNTNCSVDEYINGEGDVPVCMQYDDNWEESFFAELGSTSHSLDQDDLEDAEDGEQFDLEPPPPKLTRFQEAISSLEDVQSFLDSKGYSDKATKLTSSVNACIGLPPLPKSQLRQTDNS